jgi:excisionase family DNA binding protein
MPLASFSFADISKCREAAKRVADSLPNRSCGYCVYLGGTMTAKITVERISAQAARVTLVAEIQISGNLATFAPRDGAWQAAGSGSSGVAPAADGGAQEHELLTVEETAEILHIGRDKTYSLIRTGQLRSIKIGKLRRVSRAWIADFVESARPP